MAFIKALLLEIFRPLFCSLAGIKRAILFKYLDRKQNKSLSTSSNPKADQK
ncbi:hypothetical protein JCM30760_23540 [Thiomicrorhabdus hydrogeniphila]